MLRGANQIALNCQALGLFGRQGSVRLESIAYLMYIVRMSGDRFSVCANGSNLCCMDLIN